MSCFHFRVRRTDAGAIDPLEIDFPTADVEQLQLIDKCARVNSDADQCAENHVAARAGETVEVEGLHKLLRSVPRAVATGSPLIAKIETGRIYYPVATGY